MVVNVSRVAMVVNIASASQSSRENLVSILIFL